jgi:hypothetical protein
MAACWRAAIPHGSNLSPRRCTPWTRSTWTPRTRAYAQTAAGARFTAVSYWGPGQTPERHRPPPGVLLAQHFTAVDDRGTSYKFSASLGGPRHAEWSGELDLRPNPPPEIRWLDLSTTAGEPPTRIDLNSRRAWPSRPAEITVTPTAVSPGELLLTDIAAGFLAVPVQPPARPARRPVRAPRDQRPPHRRAAHRRLARTVAEPAEVLPWREPRTGPCPRLGRHGDRAARAGRRPGHGPRPAQRQVRPIPASAGQRRGRRNTPGPTA